MELTDATTINLAAEDGCFSASEWHQMGGHVSALKPSAEATTPAGANNYTTLSARVATTLLDHTGNSRGKPLGWLPKGLTTRFLDYKLDQGASLAMFLDPHLAVVVYHPDDATANWAKNLALEGKFEQVTHTHVQKKTLRRMSPRKGHE